MLLIPSSSCTVAATGQTGSQGAFSQCMQRRGWWDAPRVVRPPRVAGGVLAVHAEAGLVVRLGVVEAAVVVAVDVDPLHLAAPGHLLLAHDRDVVLRLAGHDAGAAADAGIQVDRHPPGVPRPGGPEP